MRPKVLLTVIIFSIVSFSFGQKDTLVEIRNISIDSMGNLKWKITYLEDESRRLDMDIEQFKGGKWVVASGGTSQSELFPPDKRTASKITRNDSVRLKFHKGENRFRIKVTYPSKFISEEVVLNSKVANDDGSVWIMGSKIFLEQKETYEILNSVGATIAKGEGKTIDISALPNGKYFFYTKESTKPFEKR